MYDISLIPNWTVARSFQEVRLHSVGMFQHVNTLTFTLRREFHSICRKDFNVLFDCLKSGLARPTLGNLGLAAISPAWKKFRALGFVVHAEGWKNFLPLSSEYDATWEISRARRIPLRETIIYFAYRACKWDNTHATELRSFLFIKQFCFSLFYLVTFQISINFCPSVSFQQLTNCIFLSTEWNISFFLSEISLINFILQLYQWVSLRRNIRFSSNLAEQKLHLQLRYRMI